MPIASHPIFPPGVLESLFEPVGSYIAAKDVSGSVGSADAEEGPGGFQHQVDPLLLGHVVPADVADNRSQGATVDIGVRHHRIRGIGEGESGAAGCQG